MILSIDQIKNIILNNPNKALINEGRKASRKMKMHLYGIGLNEDLPMVEGFETASLRSLRVKYAKSNKDLMSRLTRPVDKVFSAKGGSVYYNLSDAQDKKARQLAVDIRSGYSVKQWIENFWKPHFLDDPAGIIFMEIAPSEQALRLRAMGKNICVPTYKSTNYIYDYLPNGVSLEYVVFALDRIDKLAAGLNPEDIVFRVVDDAMDYYVKQEGQEITVMDSLSMPNLFMKVPGILNSDIVNPNINGNVISPLDEVADLAQEFLLTGSIKITHKFLHGFPKYWEYADTCITCGGSKYKDGDDCPDCKGTGKRLMTKVSDTKLLEHPQTKDDPIITPNVAGYVSPDKTYWEISTSDLQTLEDLMSLTLWGAVAMPKTQGTSIDASGGQKTATEIMSDIKPQSDRLYSYTESAEKRHKFIIDAAIQINIDQNYKGAMVNYGKRYMLEEADIIWEKYSKAKTTGAAASVLDDLLLEYYESKYDSDPIKLAIQAKLMKVEPFVHYTILQVKNFGVTDIDFYKKTYFGEWLSTLNDAMVLSFSPEALLQQLTSYAEEKMKEKPEPIAGTSTTVRQVA